MQAVKTRPAPDPADDPVIRYVRREISEDEFRALAAEQYRMDRGGDGDIFAAEEGERAWTYYKAQVFEQMLMSLFANPVIKNARIERVGGNA